MLESSALVLKPSQSPTLSRPGEFSSFPSSRSNTSNLQKLMKYATALWIEGWSGED